MTSAPTDQRWIERVEAARDLRTQLGNLDKDEEQEIQFTEWSPGRKLVTIWSMESGEEVTLPRYQAQAAVNSFMWTADKSKAPKRRVNNVKCFLHPESPERAVLNELGVTRTCSAAHLANNGSKRTHAENRHKAEWRQLQEHLNEQREAEYRQLQTQQTEAMLALAGKSAEAGPATEGGVSSGKH